MLIDTDILIWYMRGNLKAAKFLAGSDAVTLSAITYMELVQGMRNKLELQALRTTIRSWGTRILPISESVSDRAVLYVEEHFLSSALRLADALIAATAVEYGLTLATGNTKHYRIVKELVTERFRP